MPAVGGFEQRVSEVVGRGDLTSTVQAGEDLTNTVQGGGLTSAFLEVVLLL